MPAVSRRSLIAAAPAALAAAWSGAAAERLVVSKKGSRFRTVQEAIDAVPRGNQRLVTIEVRKGIYTERITFFLELGALATLAALGGAIALMAAKTRRRALP